jgi:hypothetical protein
VPSRAAIHSEPEVRYDDGSDAPGAGPVFVFNIIPWIAVSVAARSPLRCGRDSGPRTGTGVVKPEVVMRIKYHTSKGSIYTHTLKGERDYWVKEDKDGQVHPLMEAIHISKAKLQELVREYPSTLLDRTYCFDAGVEKEFFEDAKQEPCDGLFETGKTVIVFMVKRDSGRYAIGCSSDVVRVEQIE